MAINNFDPAKEGATQFDPTQQGATAVQSPLSGVEQAGSGVARFLGLGAIPGGISAATEMPNEIGALIGKLTGNNAPVQKYQQSLAQDPFANPSLVQATQGQNPSGFKQAMQEDSGVGGFNSAMTYAPEALGIGSLFKKGAGAVGDVLSHPTQGVINSQRDAAIAKSVKAGASTTWDEVSSKLRDLASQGKNKYVSGLQDEINKIITSRQPASVLENVTPNKMELVSPKLDAQELHYLRQGIDESLKGTWGNPNIRNVGIKANQLLRQVVSDSLHSIAPETKKLDDMYHLYSNPLVKGAKLPVVGNLKYPQAMSGLPSAAINTVLGTLLGEEGLKVLKKLGL